jgi:amphi-Trp domain-containing protein
MSREKVLVKSEETRNRDQVAEFLRTMASKVETGTLTLRQGTEELTLEIPGSLKLEFKVEEKTGTSPKIQVEIELEWRKNGERREGVTIV